MRVKCALVAMAVLATVASTTAQVRSIVDAARTNDRSAVLSLIRSGTKVDNVGADGSTALLWAVYHQDLELTRALLSAGSNPNSANRYGVTPLLQAARTGDTAIIEALLNRRATANASGPEGESALMAVARAGRVDAIRLLLARGAAVNHQDDRNESALMWAAAEGHSGALDALLEAGADPNLRARTSSLSERRHGDHPSGGFTALMWAARNGHSDAVKRLVAKGVDIDASNGDGVTAQILAIVNDRLEVARLLSDLGADPHDGSLYFAVDMHDATTDMRARDGGLLRWDYENTTTALDLVRLYLSKGADPDQLFSATLHSTSLGTGDTHHATPFYRAAVAADVEVLKLLVANGGDLEYRPFPVPDRRVTNVGRTPIMAAVLGGRGYAFGAGPGFSRPGAPEWREPGSRSPIEAVQVLIAAGADPNAQATDDGNTVLHLAAERSDSAMIEALEATGKVDPWLYNWVGQRALEVAEGVVEKYTPFRENPDMLLVESPPVEIYQAIVDQLRQQLGLTPLHPNAAAKINSEAGGR